MSNAKESLDYWAMQKIEVAEMASFQGKTSPWNDDDGDCDCDCRHEN